MRWGGLLALRRQTLPELSRDRPALSHDGWLGPVRRPATRAAVRVPVALVRVRIEPHLVLRLRILLISAVASRLRLVPVAASIWIHDPAPYTPAWRRAELE